MRLAVHCKLLESCDCLCLQVDAVVDHFMRFMHEERTLPVVWHQSLLVFIQRSALRS